MESILIKNVQIVTCNPRNEVFRGDILIEENRIAKLGDVREKTDYVINGKRKVALPGFINAHTHLAMTLFRGIADDMELMSWLTEKIWPLEMKLKRDDVYWGALLGCVEMIKSGTTCFVDQYFFMDAVAKAIEETGMRGFISHGIIDLGDEEKREKDIREAVRIVKDFHGKADGRILTMFGPHAPYSCSRECLLEIKDLARKFKVGIMIHLAESEKDVQNTISFQGEKPIEFLQNIGFLGPEILAAHCVQVSKEEAETLKKNDVKVAHNPQSNLKLASGIAPIWDFIKRGITVAIGTDGAASNNNLDMFEEIRTCSLLAKVKAGNPTVVDAMTALRIGTINGAKAVGLEREIGSIEIGKKADIILVDLRKPHLTPLHNVVSNLVYSASGCDVCTVIVNGRIIMEDRHILTVDEEQVIEKAQQVAEDLVSR
ncbi:MAG: amidohydrolase family protein [Candidatus Hadarchaeales archaeon]